MIRLYWPYKKVPEYLEVVRFYSRGERVCGRSYHYGFGVVVKVSGAYLVWAAAGTFLQINGNGNDVELSGGCKGVSIYFSLCAWLSALRQSMKDAQ